MINPFKAIGNAAAKGKQGLDFMAQAMQIQKALEAEEFEVVQDNVRIVINGSQNVKIVEIDGVPNEEVKRTINEAIKRSQQAAAGKLADISKNLNL